MRSIEEIKGNCVIEPGATETQDHWIWTGAYTLSANQKHRTAMAWSYDYEREKMRTQSVPRALWQMEHLEPIPAGKTPRQMCTVKGCVNPDCWRVMSNAEYGRWQRRTGFLAGRQVYFTSNKKTWDKRGRKISPEKSRELMLDQRKAHVIAAELGVDPSTVNKHRQGTLGTRVRLGPFVGLLR